VLERRNFYDSSTPFCFFVCLLLFSLKSLHARSKWVVAANTHVIRSKQAKERIIKEVHPSSTSLSHSASYTSHWPYTRFPHCTERSHLVTPILISVSWKSLIITWKRYRARWLLFVYVCALVWGKWIMLMHHVLKVQLYCLRSTSTMGSIHCLMCVYFRSRQVRHIS
jgi:hypothetical protein